MKGLLSTVLMASLSLLVADVKSTKGQIRFDADSDGSQEMVLNSNGLGVGVTPSSNLQVQGNAIITNQLSVGGSGSSNLHVFGSVGYSIDTVTSSGNASDQSLILVDTSSDNVSLTLPDASSATGRVYQIKKKTTDGTLLVLPNGSNDIDGKPYFELTTNNSSSIFPYQSLISDGSNWYVLNQSSEGISTVSGANLLWEDNFDDNSIDGALWSTSAHEETDGVMRLDITSNAEVVSSAQTLDMDYDSTVILDWDYSYDASNTEFYIQIDGSDWDVYFMRRKFGFSDITFRFVNTGNTINSSITSTVDSGKFMIDYIANTGVCTGYWHDGDAWVEVGNTSGNVLGTGSAMQVHLRNWSAGTSRVDFDNFSAFGEAP